MTEEILKTLDKIYYNYENCDIEKYLDKIKDYIINLQHIEEQHKKLNGELRKENKKLQLRCEKAIEEYTKTYRTMYYTMKYYRDSKQIEKCDILYNDCIKKLDDLDLLNILNGSNQNE